MLDGGKILDRLIDIAPKGAENVMLGSGNLPVCAEESDKRVPQCLGARLIGPQTLVLSVG